MDEIQSLGNEDGRGVRLFEDEIVVRKCREGIFKDQADKEKDGLQKVGKCSNKLRRRKDRSEDFRSLDCGPFYKGGRQVWKSNNRTVR